MGRGEKEWWAEKYNYIGQEGRTGGGKRKMMADAPAFNRWQIQEPFDQML